MAQRFGKREAKVVRVCAGLNRPLTTASITMIFYSIFVRYSLDTLFKYETGACVSNMKQAHACSRQGLGQR